MTEPQRKLWDLEYALFDAKRQLAEIQAWPEDDMYSRYRKRLTLVDIHRFIQTTRAAIASTPHQAKEHITAPVQQPLFALALVPKPKRKKGKLRESN